MIDFLNWLKYLAPIMLSLSFGFSVNLFAVTKIKKSKKLHFTTNLIELQPSVRLPLSDNVELITKSEKKIKTRIVKSTKDERVEPVSILVKKDSDDQAIWKQALKVAKAGSVNVLFKYIKQMLPNAKPVKPDSEWLQVNFSKGVINYLDFSAIAKTYEGKHHNLTLDNVALTSDLETKNKFLSQIRTYLSPTERRRLLMSLKQEDQIAIDQLLLPKFARKMVKKYTVYRGPNCFHASLAFQSPLLPKSKFVNVKEEEGYHRAMINYDELWRVLSTKFYEVDLSQNPLKYGDVLVFFETSEADNSSKINFRWIRHAAAYLFNDYTFSKGSKSPNTPYTVKTLAEEWSTWSKYTKKLGLKVFRRNQGQRWLQNSPKNLKDWLY